MKNNDYIIRKLDLTRLFQAGNFWRDGIGPKLIVESETNVIEFLQISLRVAKLYFASYLVMNVFRIVFPREFTRHWRLRG